jgi:aryl-alcohol dehydrogenase-like predicted oxidoreductase
MNYRTLGKTGLQVSEISLGTWQLGNGWSGEFDDGAAEATLDHAVASGVNFIDTADVYSDGLSERKVGEFIRKRREDLVLATKCGRRLSPHVAAGYNRKNITGFVEDSLKRTGLPALQLIQLHCPPTDVYYHPEVFETLQDLRQQGKILNYGVSVERIEEALKAIEYPGVATVQIIFNMFRQRPAELFFEQAQKKNIGVIVRVPLASGLLSGKMTKNTAFSPSDHRSFNRDGAAFDKGETFSGVPFDIGLQAVEELKRLFDLTRFSLAQYALRWILMFDAVSCVIPGASRQDQIVNNAAASDMPALTPDQMAGVREIYNRLIKPHVHQLW